LLPAGRAGEPPGRAPAGSRLGSRAGRPAAAARGLRPVHPHPPPAPHRRPAAGHHRPRRRHRRPMGRANHHRCRPQAAHPRRGGAGDHHRGGHQRTRGRGDHLGRRAHHRWPDHPPRRPPGPAQLLPPAGRAGPPAGRAGPPRPGHRQPAARRRLPPRQGTSAHRDQRHHPAPTPARLSPSVHSRPHRPAARRRPGPHEWWLDDLAAELAMPPITLHSWLRRGWVHARQESRRPYRWIIHADPHQLAELRLRRSRPAGWYTRRRWTDAQSPGHNGSRDHPASPHI
jgi:hypothetical protein